jgi:hypothetical protein
MAPFLLGEAEAKGKLSQGVIKKSAGVEAITCNVNVNYVQTSV